MHKKMDIMPKDQVVDVLQGYFKLDAITEARDLLYRNPPPDLPGRLKRRTSKRDILEDMYDVMQMFAVHAPTASISAETCIKHFHGM